jgi:hypothetical protein
MWPNFVLRKTRLGEGMNNRRKLIIALGAGKIAAPFASFA